MTVIQQMNPMMVSPESVGISSALLEKILLEISDQCVMNSMQILRHGKRCLRAFWRPYEPDCPHMMFSVSKMFVSLAVGFAETEGQLRLDAPVYSFFPEYESCIADPLMRETKVVDLLTLRSGHNSCTLPLFRNADDGDWVKCYLSSHLTWRPGTRFQYNSGASYMLAAIIRKISGLNVREYLAPRLFMPLGIIPGIWECCPKGTNCGGWGLYLTTDDLAKCAELLLGGGVFHDRRVIPAEYLRRATSIQAETADISVTPDGKCGYGYQFWMSRHGYRADGSGGQLILVLPEYDMAIITTGCMENTFKDIIWNRLLPSVSRTALPENPDHLKSLETVVKNLSMPVMKDDFPSQNGAVHFYFETNSAGIESCAIDFGDFDCALTFRRAGGRIEQLRAGFGNFRTSIFQLNDNLPHPYAASAAWRDEHVLEIQAFTTDGNYCDSWQIDFMDERTPIKYKNNGIQWPFRMPFSDLIIKRQKIIRESTSK